MPSIPSLIAARRRGHAGDLRALAVALAREVKPPPELPTDPAALWDAVEDAASMEFVPGTWQEVRAAVLGLWESRKSHQNVVHGSGPLQSKIAEFAGYPSRGDTRAVRTDQ